MSLKRQSAWSMAPLLVVTVVNIFSVRLFYHYLGPEMYAILFCVNTLNGSFGFVDMGLGVAVVRYIGVALGAQDNAAVRQYWGTGNALAIPLLLFMSAGFVAIGAGFGPHWFSVGAANTRLLQWAFLGGGIALFLNYYTQFWLMLSQAHLDFKFIGLLRSVISVIQVLTSVVLAWWTGNPLLVIAGGIALSLVQLACFVWHARVKYDLGLNLREASVARAREMAAYTGKTFAALLVSSFGASVDRLFLGKFAPPAVFTLYNISYNFSSRIAGVGSSVMGPIFHQTSRAVGRGSRGSTAAIYNEMFQFTFGWYALASIWTVCWHPILLRMWLGPALGAEVSPAFTPLVIAFCFTGVAMISSAQLGPLNRMGVELTFSILNMLSLGTMVLIGWNWGGLAGVGWGVLASRITLLMQDLYVIRLVGGGGWLSRDTWKHLLMQTLVGLLFYGVGRFWTPTSLWSLIPAALHGGLMAAWLLRAQLRKALASIKVFLPQS